MKQSRKKKETCVRKSRKAQSVTQFGSRNVSSSCKSFLSSVTGINFLNLGLLNSFPFMHKTMGEDPNIIFKFEIAIPSAYII